jgi:hypothetical protein
VLTVLLLSINPLDAATSGALNNPVNGVKLSLVLDTFAPEIEPDVALVNVGYNAVAVDVSSVIVTPAVTVEAIDIEPEPGVILIPAAAVNEALVNVFPVELPISNWPSVYELFPVPPAFTGKVPLVNDDVDVAYKAPLVVKLVSPVPP